MSTATAAKTEAPQAAIADWTQPREVSTALLAFPGSVSHLMPAYADIPAGFDRPGGIWTKWQAQWFYKGLQQRPTPKDGIDLERAVRHLACIQRSFEPKHEHKSAAVAYLASLWFERP